MQGIDLFLARLLDSSIDVIMILDQLVLRVQKNPIANLGLGAW